MVDASEHKTQVILESFAGKSDYRVIPRGGYRPLRKAKFLVGKL